MGKTEISNTDAGMTDGQAVPPPVERHRQALFDSLCDVFKDSIRQNWSRADVEQHPLGRRLIRLVRATFEQRASYPEQWRAQFVRHARTLHSLTGYREVRLLMFDWLRARQFLPATADFLISAEPLLRRHLERLSHFDHSALERHNLPVYPPAAADLTVMTVDNPETRDRDDALSLRREGGNYEIGVHTPLLETFVPRGSAVDRWAAQVAVSLYMPHLCVPMLPEVIASQYAGLNAGTNRPVLSFYFRTGAGPAPVFHRVCCENLVIGHNSDYDQVAEWLAWFMMRGRMGAKWKVTQKRSSLAELENALQVWAESALQLEQQRVAAGGRVFDREQVDVLVGAEGTVSLRRYSQSSPAHKMVSEWMIAANQAAAYFFASRGLPCIYRVQEKTVPASAEAEAEGSDSFVRPQPSMKMAPHHDLGLAGYTQITSPLRRYADLLMQRQLVSFLQQGVPAYAEEELWQQAQRLEDTGRRLHRLSARAELHYKCVYLGQNLGEVFEAEIHHSPPPGRSVVLTLPRLALRLFVPLSGIKGVSARQIPPAGTPLAVRVICREMDARRGNMVFHVQQRVPARG